MKEDDEEGLLRSVALQNASSIFVARQRAEQELLRVREALEAKTIALAKSLAVAEALLEERDRARAEADAARRAAEEANDAKGRFVSLVSHELRTPLGAIGGYAGLLEEGIHGPLSGEQLRFIARIRHNQQHLLRLVNELLDLSKMESGQFPLNTSAVVAETVLDSVKVMVEPQVRERRLQICVDPGDPALRFYADGDRVEQIILNLVSNAIKSTPEGGTVTITTAAAGDSVEVQVRDTGIGIDAANLEMIFEPFFQVPSAINRESRGTGLGLAISRQLARAMEGDLKVDSTPGLGSVFTLRLNRVVADGSEPAGEHPLHG